MRHRVLVPLDWVAGGLEQLARFLGAARRNDVVVAAVRHEDRSEEHTSELQSRLHLVCRLLLEKKKKHTHRYRSAGLRARQRGPTTRPPHRVSSTSGLR